MDIISYGMRQVERIFSKRRLEYVYNKLFFYIPISFYLKSHYTSVS